MVRGLVLHDLRRCCGNDIHLLLVRVGASQENVVEHLLAIQSIALCDLHDALRTTTCELFAKELQGSLGVQEDHLSVGSVPGV